MTRFAGWIARGLMAAGAVACGDDQPAPRTPDRIAVTAGSGQSAAAGSTLPAPVGFTVADGRGPLAGVPVRFTLGDGTGVVAPRSDTTGADGTVATRWTVGGTIGQQTLRAEVTGLGPAIATATVTAGPPAVLSVASHPSQFVVVGRAVVDLPTVAIADRFENPLPGIPITFEDESGRSVVTGGSQISDQAGRATVGGWRLPNRIGTYTLIARAGPLFAVMAAFAIPARVDPVVGDQQAANAGTEVPVAPSVIALDEAGQPLADAIVTFRVAAGGGRLLGAPQVATGPDGIAAAPGWVLGLVPGDNRLEAAVAGVPPVVMTATGLAAEPAALAAAGSSLAPGLLGNYTGSLPAVVVTDAAGRPVAGATVTFTVAAGGGTLRGDTPLTDFQGRARLGSWRLGPAAATQSVRASVAGLPPLDFEIAAAPPPASQFQITIRFIGPEPTPSQRAAFEAAAARWSKILLNDLSDESFTPVVDLSFCGGQQLDETIDDLLIFAKISRIDGAGGVLGRAGICYVRDAGLLPVIGLMEFDADDVTALETAGQFDEVVLHEMGHVLGIGSLWQDLGLLIGGGSGNPVFTGPSSQASFTGAATAGTSFSGDPVPVENTGGSGTRDAHWRESVLGGELMTGFLNPGANPLSAITVGSLRDEGYLANDLEADGFTFAAALRALAGPSLRLSEGPWTAPIRTIDRRGMVRRILFR